MTNFQLKISSYLKQVRILLRKTYARLGYIISSGDWAPLTDRQNRIVKTFNSPLGYLIAEREQRFLSDTLREYSGGKILQLTVNPAFSIDSPSPFRYVARVFAGTGAEAMDNSANLIGEFHALPFANGEFDIVVVQHVMEFSENPQGVLKEAGRVTKSSGHLTLLAFNPLSPSGTLAAVLSLVRKGSFWDRRYLLSYRLLDWLKFIDFTLLRSKAICHTLPINIPAFYKFNMGMSSLMERLGIPVSSVICLVARKDQLGLTLTENKSWRKASVGQALFGPASSATTRLAGEDLAEAKILKFRNKRL